MIEGDSAAQRAAQTYAVDPLRGDLLAAQADIEQQITALDVQRQALTQQLTDIGQDRRSHFLGLVQGYEDSPIASYAGSIYQRAVAAQADPSWFFGRLSQEAGIAIRSSLPGERDPEEEPAETYYRRGMNDITRRSYGNDLFMGHPMKMFEKAAELAQAREEAAGITERNRESLVYKWLAEHAPTLIRMHGEHWWNHY